MHGWRHQQVVNVVNTIGGIVILVNVVNTIGGTRMTMHNDAQ
jgi:hypothetical protein